MKKLTTLLAAAGIISGCFVFAQDENPAPQRRERGPRTERMRPQHRNDPRETAEAKLKEKYPAEYAEIEKLRDEAETKLQALAKKAGVQLPFNPETMRKKMTAVRAKYPKEFEEIDKLRKTDPRAAREKMQEIYRKEGIEFPAMQDRRHDRFGANQPSPRRGNPMVKIQQIRAAYPEEMKKLDELRRDDPGRYREEMRKLAERYEREHAKAK